MKGNEIFQQLYQRPPFTKLAPTLAEFFQSYLRHEKAIRFGDQTVINTHFPPVPSPALDQLVNNFNALGDAATRRLYSVTLAVTNRCLFQCWHCYNAGRSQVDLSVEQLRPTITRLQDLGAVMVTLTGGEPLLRPDLEEIVGAFDSRSCLILGTTGAGLTVARAQRLKEKGLFGVGISLDSQVEAEHDEGRGKTGAFRIALRALETAGEAGLYPYVVSVATRKFLEPARFHAFLRFVADQGALEVHLLEPCATGKLSGHFEECLTPEERRKLATYQREIAARADLPILSSLTYLESAKAFGCGAGLTHLYIDGSGEVCPCNLVPLSFGNIRTDSLDQILAEMSHHFRQPRTGCVGKQMAHHLSGVPQPTPPRISRELCRRVLRKNHPTPRFFQLLQRRGKPAAAPELRRAYDSVHR